jgi:O-antigen/teichoic acid export membrane protein
VAPALLSRSGKGSRPTPVREMTPPHAQPDGTSPAPSPDPWGSRDRQLARLARNVSMRYLVIGVDIAVGLILLPFNLSYLGKAAYGVWVLAASITSYFNMLDLGYGGALVKFVAQYRAWRDAEAINRIVSTLFCVFAGIGLLAFAGAAALAFNLETFLRLTPEQAEVGRSVVLIVGLQVAIGFPFTVYGSVINGFQRYDANSLVSVVSTIAVAVVNVAVLVSGYGLVELVAATTAVRIAALFLYRMNAYWIFPLLRVRPSLFDAARLREVSGFSVYALLIDLANKMNYSLAPLIVGAFLGPTSVTLWTVAQRIAVYTQQLTNQLNSVLFPTIVDSDAGRRPDRLRQILLQGTRLSMATVVPLTTAILVLGGPLIQAWLGPGYEASVLLLQILAVAVTIRVGGATATMVLKGAGLHRTLAVVNLSAGVCNVALSILLIGPFGLTGVALAALFTIAPAGMFVLFPLACRRVDLPIAQAVRRGAWPGLWPASVTALVLLLLQDHLPATLLAIAAQTGLGLLVYLATFFGVAVGRDDRRAYLAKVRELLRRPRRVPAAA